MATIVGFLLCVFVLSAGGAGIAPRYDLECRVNAATGHLLANGSLRGVRQVVASDDVAGWLEPNHDGPDLSLPFAVIPVKVAAAWHVVYEHVAAARPGLLFGTLLAYVGGPRAPPP